MREMLVTPVSYEQAAGDRAYRKPTGNKCMYNIFILHCTWLICVCVGTNMSAINPTNRVTRSRLMGLFLACMGGFVVTMLLCYACVRA